MKIRSLSVWQTLNTAVAGEQCSARARAAAPAGSAPVQAAGAADADGSTCSDGSVSTSGSGPNSARAGSSGNTVAGGSGLSDSAASDSHDRGGTVAATAAGAMEDALGTARAEAPAEALAEPAKQTKKRQRDERSAEMLHARDTTVKCEHCGKQCLSARGLRIHDLGCGPGRSKFKRQRKQLVVSDLAETITLSRFADVQGSGSTGAVHASSTRDVYALCAGKFTLSLPRPRPWPKGWAARTAKSMTMKTPQQLLLLVEEFLHVKAGHARTPISVLLAAVNSEGPALTELQLRSHHGALEQKWKADHAAVQASAHALRADMTDAQLQAAEAAAILASDERDDNDAVERLRLLGGDLDEQCSSEGEDEEEDE